MPLQWIALNSVKGLGPVKIQALVEKYGSAAEAFERLGDEPVLGLNPPAINKTDLLEYARAQVALAEKLQIRILTLADAQYPSQLKEIYAPPPVLYVKGSTDVFKKHAVAIIGTRRFTEYGKNVTMSLVKDLVRKNLVIVSGLAHGIDTVAHKTCLENGGETIAVLGCGIDMCYPRENLELSERIAKSGALVSEFALGTQPENFNFPRRNRIISGLSAGVAVIEAPIKSGSLITANYALQQGRDVFAVPGSIFSPNSQGPFNLIRDGAVPISRAADIIESISQVGNFTIAAAKKSAGNLSGVAKMPLDLLSAPERNVYDSIGEAPMRIDEIADKTAKPLADMFDVLLSLELKGFIKQVSGQQYLRA